MVVFSSPRLVSARLIAASSNRSVGLPPWPTDLSLQRPKLMAQRQHPGAELAVAATADDQDLDKYSRLHAVLHHEGWRCRRSQLLTHKGRRWVDGLQFSGAAQQQVAARLLLIDIP